MIKSKLSLLTHYCWFARFEKKNIFLPCLFSVAVAVFLVSLLFFISVVLRLLLLLLLLCRIRKLPKVIMFFIC